MFDKLSDFIVLETFFIYTMSICNRTFAGMLSFGTVVDKTVGLIAIIFNSLCANIIIFSFNKLESARLRLM